MSNFIEILKAILMGIVEGVTEWLPISSTGHMIILETLLPFNLSKEFMEMFLVVIQLGAIIAVIFIFFQKLNPFSKTKTTLEKKDTWMMWLKVLVAVIPAAIIGLIFDDKIDEIFYNWQTVSITLIIYGILFIIIEIINKNKETKINDIKELTFKTALLIGVFQLLALIPGTSRSGATILGAIILGCSRSTGAEFSFFMAIPVMFGASFLKIIKFGFVFSSLEIGVLVIGMITAFVVSLFSIKFLMSYVQKHDFKFFGYYRIALGVIVILFFTIKLSMGW